MNYRCDDTCLNRGYQLFQETMGGRVGLVYRVVIFVVLHHCGNSSTMRYIVKPRTAANAVFCSLSVKSKLKTKDLFASYIFH